MSSPRSRTSESDSLGRGRAVRALDVGRLLLGGAPFALVVTLLCVVAAVLQTRASDPVYEASVTLVAPLTAPAVGDPLLVTPSVIDPAVYRSAVFEGGVLADAAEALEGRALGASELTAYANRVRVSIEEQERSSLLRIQGRASTPERAAGLANGVAQTLVAWDRERARQSVDAAVTALEQAIAEIDALLDDPSGASSPEQLANLETIRAQRTQALAEARARAAAAVPVPLISPLRAADPPERAVGPRLVLNTAIAIVLGLALGYGLVVLRRVTRPVVADARDVADVVDAPVLATFSRHAHGDAVVADEASSVLQARVVAARSPHSSMVVAVTSVRQVSEQEGVAVALAGSLARTGLATLLVDADLRSRQSTALLGAGGSGAPGLGTPAAQGAARIFGEHVTVLVDETHSFEFFPAPAPSSHPAELLSRALDAGLPDWSDAFEMVVLDAAPVAERADALVAAARADAVILCVAAGRDTRDDVASAVKAIAVSGGVLLGAVVTRPGPRRGTTA